MIIFLHDLYLTNLKQEELIKQLQEQHFEQYMNQVYQQQLLHQQQQAEQLRAMKVSIFSIKWHSLFKKQKSCLLIYTFQICFLLILISNNSCYYHGNKKELQCVNR